MANNRKIILFLVEGISDEESLSAILSEIIRDDVVSFQITRGDLTSKKGANQTNIINSINQKVIEYMNKEKVRRTDILHIIHLIDIDGAYIKDEQYMSEDPDMGSGFFYAEDKIYSCNKQRIKDRNTQKSTLMNKLCSLNEISGTKYRAYYFCCNLDHVFHDERNLDEALKVEYAENFQDRFYGREKEFLEYISKSEFSVNGTYNETWSFLKDGLNSLGRHCNFHLFFEEFKKYINEKFI